MEYLSFRGIVYELDGAMNEYRDSNDDGLAHFQSVDSRQYVDRIGTKYGDEGHVHVVKQSWIGYA